MPGKVHVLDAEFLFLLSLLRPVFAGLASEHRPQARRWLERLIQTPARGDKARTDRNEYLCRLYYCMVKNRLDSVFLEEPPEGPLQPAQDVFSPMDVTSWLKGPVPGPDVAASGSGDADERTYLATKGGRLARPSVEQRQHLLDFYDSLLRDLDQAMAGPEKTSPAMERLIASFQDSSTSAAPEGPTADVSTHQKELLSQLRERLCARRERAQERSQLLDSLELDDEIGLSVQPPTGAHQPCQDEDDVSHIRPENVALLEAAYPRQLVNRFLEAIVRERVSVLGRVRARRYCQRHVEGMEEDAAKDTDHYREATTAWARVLREYPLGSAETVNTAASTAKQAERCAHAAMKATAGIKELAETRRHYFQRQKEMCNEQDRLNAELEMLRSEEAALKRRLQQTLGNDSSSSARK